MPNRLETDPQRRNARAPEPASAQGDVLLAKFERPDGEVRVLWRQFKGSFFVDARHYWRLSDSQWSPTKKGVTFRADCLAELATAIAKAQRLAAAQGAED